MGLADEFGFASPICRVLLVLWVLSELLVQEVLVYVHGEDFFTN